MYHIIQITTCNQYIFLDLLNRACIVKINLKYFFVVGNGHIIIYYILSQIPKSYSENLTPSKRNMNRIYPPQTPSNLSTHAKVNKIT